MRWTPSQSRRRLLLVCLAAGGCLAFGGSPASAASGWTVVSNPGAPGTGLWAVSASSASNVWAVGYTQDDPSGEAAFAERWDGSKWTVVQPLTFASGQSDLEAVAAIGPKNVWAAGWHAGVGYLEHWNGKAWSLRKSPTSQCGPMLPEQMVAISASDIWIGGESSGCTSVAQYDGHSWTATDLDGGSDSGNDVLGMAASGASNIWTTGNGCAGAGGCWSVGYQFNGSDWAENEGSPDLWKIFNGVATLSPTETWEVGYHTASDESGHPKGPQMPLAAHWNGLKWKIENPPHYSTSHSLNAVAESSASNVWAVGNRYTTNGAERTLIDNWNGSRWVDVGGPNVGTGDNELDAVVRVPGTATFWAVGHSADGALILRTP